MRRLRIELDHVPHGLPPTAIAMYETLHMPKDPVEDVTRLFLTRKPLSRLEPRAPKAS